MSDYQTITIEKREQADWLTFNRPHALNAINLQMVKELHDYFGTLFHDRSVRVVVMRGAGRGFCAGLDLKESAASSAEEVPFGGGFGLQGYLADVYVRMRRCPQPIVSLIHGAACGGGFAFVLASDIRIAAESARMNAAFIKLGLTGCDMGVSYFLPRLVGLSVASELIMTGRFVDAQRSLRIGLVSEVVAESALEEAGSTLVQELLATSPRGLRMTKEGIGLSVDAPSLEAAMAIENRNQLMTSSAPNFAEGMRAFIEKRSPNYLPD
jgi:enoyl-CoA hydratase/carnithine racemase